MLKIYSYILIAFSAFSCNSFKYEKDKSLTFILESQFYCYKTDFNEGRFYAKTKSFVDTTIIFKISDLEKQKIVDKYYSLKLDELDSNEHIIGEFPVLPPNDFKITIKGVHINQSFTINIDDKQFSINNTGKANRLKQFIYFLIDIENSRHEIDFNCVWHPELLL